MIKAISQKLEREEGFTLIELMIVMVVLGILAGIVIFATGGFQQGAENATDEANDKICDTARAAYAATAGQSDRPAFNSFFANNTPPTGCTP
jgi:prepilin-type N-terminal cleavage/methylation domain-containing protein